MPARHPARSLPISAPPPPTEPPSPATPPGTTPGPDPAEHRRRRDRLEAVTRVSRRAAHDLNNLVMVVQGALEMAAARFDADPDRARRMLDHAQVAIERAQELGERLHVLAGPAMQGEQPVDAHAEARDHLARLAPPDTAGVTVSQETEADAGYVRLDAPTFRSLLDVLVQNAFDAMPDGGRLSVRTQNVHAAPAGGPPDVEPGAYVKITVEDTGEGMDAETRDRLFEPFFTTRQDKNRGFGLAILHGIVHHRGGRVWVTSSPGNGSTFEVWLPREDDPHDG